MNNFFNKIVRLFCLCVFLFGHSSADAQNRNLPADINPYFGPVGKQPVMPNAAGLFRDGCSWSQSLCRSRAMSFLLILI